MIKLIEFKKIGFKITWKLLNIGFKNEEKFSNMLSANEIINYAISLLDSNNNEDLLDLASSRPDEIESINMILTKLAEKEKSDYSIEYRKWQLLYVIRNMPKKDEEFIAGLCQLGDIWAYLDFPNESPHIFQGRNNNIIPNEYYTSDNFLTLYNKHIDWIEKETKQIKNIQ